MGPSCPGTGSGLRGSRPPLISAPLALRWPEQPPTPRAHHGVQLERLLGRHRHGAQAGLKGLHVGTGRPEAQQVEVCLEGPVHG